MTRAIPMPSREDLPDGPRRTFVTELRRYYRAASRPALAQAGPYISNAGIAITRYLERLGIRLLREAVPEPEGPGGGGTSRRRPAGRLVFA